MVLLAVCVEVVAKGPVGFDPVVLVDNGAADARPGAGNAIQCEIVGISHTLAGERWKNIAPKIMVGIRNGGRGLLGLDEGIGLDGAVTHRGKTPVESSRYAGRIFGFLDESPYLIPLVDVNYSKGRSLGGGRTGRQATVALALRPPAITNARMRPMDATRVPASCGSNAAQKPETFEP